MGRPRSRRRLGRYRRGRGLGRELGLRRGPLSKVSLEAWALGVLAYLPTRRPRFAGRGGPSLVLPRSTATRSGRIVDAVRQRSAMHHKSVWRFAPRELAQWQANFCSHFLSYQRLRSASPVVVNNLCGELGRCQFCGPAPACSLLGWRAVCLRTD